MATPAAGYRDSDGNKIPSVTTVLSRYKESGGLMRWNYTKGREHGELALKGVYQKKLFAFVASAQEAAREKVTLKLNELFGRWQEPVPPAPNDVYSISDKAAEAGSIAHDMIEDFLIKGAGRAIPVKWEGADDGVKQKAMNSFDQFLKWHAQTKLRVTHTEHSMVSEKHRYGGTWDGVGRDGDDLVLIDWKTSNAVYADYLYQLAAYALLIEENHPDWGPVKGFHLLRVSKEHADFAHHYFGDLEREKRAFVLMRELYEIDSVTKKRV